MEFEIITAQTAEEYKAGEALFKEYAASLDFDLAFQNIEEEWKILDKMYGPPKGALLLVKSNERYIGAVGLRQIENDQTCEIKRMYIQPGYQGQGIGKILIAKVLDTAIDLGYSLAKLDTLADRMPNAVKLYTSFGFVKTNSYNYNPFESVAYFEKNLTKN